MTCAKSISSNFFADYGVYPNGTVSVNNNARLKTPTGALDNILGWANVVSAASRDSNAARSLTRLHHFTGELL